MTRIGKLPVDVTETPVLIVTFPEPQLRSVQLEAIVPVLGQLACAPCIRASISKPITKVSLILGQINLNEIILGHR